MIKIETAQNDAAMWVNPKAIIGVAIPHLLAVTNKCQVVMTGAVVEVSREEAERVLAELQSIEAEAAQTRAATR